MSNTVEQFAVLKFRWFLANARLQSDVVGRCMQRLHDAGAARTSLLMAAALRVLRCRPAPDLSSALLC